MKFISKYSVKIISTPIFPVCMDKKTLTFLKISTLFTKLQVLNRNCAWKWSLDQQETNCHISKLPFYWIFQQGSITFLLQVCNNYFAKCNRVLHMIRTVRVSQAALVNTFQSVILLSNCVMGTGSWVANRDLCVSSRNTMKCQISQSWTLRAARLMPN